MISSKDFTLSVQVPRYEVMHRYESVYIYIHMCIAQTMIPNAETIDSVSLGALDPERNMAPILWQGGLGLQPEAAKRLRYRLKPELHWQRLGSR